MIPTAVGSPVTLRVSVTQDCSLRCLYCRPQGRVSPRHGQWLGVDEILAFVRILRRNFGLTRVRITGGEPLLRPDLPEIIRALAAEGIPDIALTTNGQRLAGVAEDLRRAGLVRVNVSLDSLDPGAFEQITGGCLRLTLDGIHRALDAGLAPVKLNMVVMRGINDSEIANMALFGIRTGCQARFLELMPIGIPRDRFEKHFVRAEEIHAQLAAALRLQPVANEPGSSSRDFGAVQQQGQTGTVGLISPCSHPFCTDCRRLRLTAAGQLVGCLALGHGVDIRQVLNGGVRSDESAVVDAVRQALAGKRTDGGFQATRSIGLIGG